MTKADGATAVAWLRIRDDGVVTYWETEVPDSTPLCKQSDLDAALSREAVLKARIAELEGQVAFLNKEAVTINQFAKDQRDRSDGLEAVFDAAYGLCFGYDWNNGSHAKRHGYRLKLLKAVNAIKPVPDFDVKALAITPDRKAQT